MDPQELADLEAFFNRLPRPLPVGLALNPAIKVTDPEKFIRAQLSLVKDGGRSAYVDTCLQRLLLWKSAYLEYLEN